MSSDSRDNDFGELPEIQRALGGLAARRAPQAETPDIRIDRERSGTGRWDDDRFLHRFFGICVMLVGVATTVPAIVHWIGLSQADELEPVPRWVYLLGFVGGLHMLYALLTIQVSDYSVLQSLAVFLLVVTCMYGFAVMAFWLGDSTSEVAQFLQIPSVLRMRAATWCGIMFAISALGCYLFGREALLLRRRVHVKRVRATL
jgi:hypothetical protein